MIGLSPCAWYSKKDSRTDYYYPAGLLNMHRLIFGRDITSSTKTVYCIEIQRIVGFNKIYAFFVHIVVDLN